MHREGRELKGESGEGPENTNERFHKTKVMSGNKSR